MFNSGSGDVVLVNPKVVQFQGRTYTVETKYLTCFEGGRFLPPINLPFPSLPAQLDAAADIDREKARVDSLNKMAIVVLDGRLVLTNGPQLFIYERSFDGKQFQLTEIARGSFVVVKTNQYCLLIDKSETKELRVDGVSTADPRQMARDIMKNPDILAKYISKQQKLVFARRAPAEEEAKK